MMRGGVFAINKPPGITSAAAVARIKHMLLPRYAVATREGASGEMVAGAAPRRARLKVGHGGTLDKAAEGVLVIGVGSACKELGRYLSCEKA